MLQQQPIHWEILKGIKDKFQKENLFEQISGLKVSTLTNQLPQSKKKKNKLHIPINFSQWTELLVSDIEDI